MLVRGGTPHRGDPRAAHRPHRLDGRVWVDRGTTWDWAIPVAYVCAIAVVATMVWKIERRYRTKRALVPELNAYLADAQIPERVTTLRAPDAMDAELLRWCYSTSPTNPTTGWPGWTGASSSTAEPSCATSSTAWPGRCRCTRRTTSRTRRAGSTGRSRKVVHKHTDLRVWGYWRTLNLLGNFDPNPDPIRRDNIMFSAFLGDVVNSFEAATGDLRFDEPASLTFVWKDGRTFEYDHHSLTAAVRKNFEPAGSGSSRASQVGRSPCAT